MCILTGTVIIVCIIVKRTATRRMYDVLRERVTENVVCMLTAFSKP